MPWVHPDGRTDGQTDATKCIISLASRSITSNHARGIPGRQDKFTPFVLRVLSVYGHCKVSIGMLFINSSSVLSSLHLDFPNSCMGAGWVLFKLSVCIMHGNNLNCQKHYWDYDLRKIAGNLDQCAFIPPIRLLIRPWLVDLWVDRFFSSLFSAVCWSNMKNKIKFCWQNFFHQQ